MVNHYRDVTKSIYLEIDKHTIQIFCDGKKGIKADSSAILVKYLEHYLIISAAHVFEMDDMPNLYFEIEKHEDGKTTFKKIGKYALLASQKVNRKRKDDKLDIAVLKLLGDEDIDLLKSNFVFYNFKDADINHKPIPQIPYYIVFGYPGSYTKMQNKYRKESERKVFVFNSRTIDFKNSEKYGYSSSNIFIDYPKQIQKDDNERLMTPPNPEGISGSGLWQITDSVNLNSKNWHYKLVGVMIELHENRILVGTKLVQIDAVIRYLNMEKSA